MVFAARSILIGGTRFTSIEATFLNAAIRQGLGVRDIRSMFRSQFSRGLPSPSFTAARSNLSQAELAGVRLSRLETGQRLSLENIPKVEVTGRSSRFVVTGRLQVRVGATGELRDFIVRYGSNQRPSLDQFDAEATRIIELADRDADYDLEVLGRESFGVVEQIEI
tara:strand:+ start:1426 stop:1923 length:498 start_codon:yes stop_codon:yes gene_type:complete